MTPTHGTTPCAFTAAIGDIHGRDDLLVELLDKLDDHALGQPYRLVCLGDYIDRGPASAEVVERLIQLQRHRPPGHVICLRGNHEQLCLDAMDTGGGWQVNHWLRSGGDTTLQSYAPAGAEPSLSHIEVNHRQWLAHLPFLHRDANRIYVHAGLQPHSPLHRQDAETFMWIREAFLRAQAGSFPAHVVHGHTPVWAGKPNWSEPEVLPHRTNLDTGAYCTGLLTAGIFKDDASGGPIKIIRAIALPKDDEPKKRF